MQIILYVLLVFAAIVILVMIYNRLYFEINLAHAMRKLNKQLKTAMKEEVEEFSKELKSTLYITIDAMTESYEELAKSLGKARETKE